MLPCVMYMRQQYTIRGFIRTGAFSDCLASIHTEGAPTNREGGVRRSFQEGGEGDISLAQSD